MLLLTPGIAAQETGDATRWAEAYRLLPRYQDEGTIRITRFEDDAQDRIRVRFVLERDAGGFRMELEPEAGSRNVLWTEGRGGDLLRYDAGSNRFAPVGSLREALPGELGEAVAEALVVARLLLGGEEASEGFPGEPEVETGQPCPRAPGEDRDASCRMLTWAPASGRDRRIRLWIGEDDGLVRRVEVEQGPGKGTDSAAWVWVEVSHAPRFPESGEVSDASFTPPAGAERVARLDEPVVVQQVPEGVFTGEVSVAELLLSVRVAGPEGQPLQGLSARDFRLWVAGREVPIQAATWVDPADPWVAELQAMSEEERRELEIERLVPGRLVVLFFQTDPNPVRIKGHMAFLPELRELVGSLAPTDRLAVASFDSHLKLWQDFTTDREGVLELARDAFRFGGSKIEPQPGNVNESLLEHLSLSTARDAATVEEALAVLGRSLEPFVADKVVLFIGWGVGHGGTSAWHEGFQALNEADVTLHAIDVTYAEAHTLAGPLSSMARSTGGIYTATYESPGFSAREVVVALSGHYELSVLASDLPPEGGAVRIELREGVRGEVYNPRREWIVKPGS